MFNLGLTYQAASEPEKAFTMYQQAAKGLEKLDFTHAEAGGIVGSLCDWLEERKQFDRADGWRKKWLAAAKKSYGPDSIVYAGNLTEQGANMLRRQRYADADPILHESLAILQKKQPESQATFHAQSLLGAALLGQKRYAEAEPLLIRGYEGVRAHQGQIPMLYARHRLAETGQRIVQLYEAWGRADKAAEWRIKLLDSGEAKPAHSGGTGHIDLHPS